MAAYLDTNVICRSQERGVSGQLLREKLEERGLIPVVGIHVIYELAKTYLNPERVNVAKELFLILKELNPIYTVGVNCLLSQECAKWASAGAIRPFADSEYKVAIDAEILKLANGVFDDTAKVFIEERERSLRVHHAAIAHGNIKAFALEPPTTKIRDFDDFVAYYGASSPILIAEICRGALSATDAVGVYGCIDEYPVIRSVLRANLYLLSVEAVQRTAPSRDKVFDHRHVIEASYCSKFVTGERQLLNNIVRINPGLEPVEWAG